MNERHRLIHARAASVVFVLLFPAGAIADGPTSDVRVIEGPTKIEQIVGEYDRSTGSFTRNRTMSRFKLAATDLGVPFTHKGKTYLLFGDTSGPPRGDAIARTSDREPEDGLDLEFIHDERGVYRPVIIPGITQGGYEVPMEGVSVAGDMFVYHTTDRSRKGEMGRSVVAVSKDDGNSFTYLYDLSNKHFINVSVVKVSAAEWDGLPDSTGTGLLVFGSGPYRKSNVRVAYQPASGIRDRRTIRYFAGLDAEGTPQWSRNETDSQALFDQKRVGELSVSYNRFLKRWIMLYNTHKKPWGIVMRTARTPWGPWSAPQVIFSRAELDGFCDYIHWNWKERRCDILQDPGRQNETGDYYGPYQFEHFARGEPGRSRIYFTLSTWNPYTVVLMKADLTTDRLSEDSRTPAEDDGR